MMKRLLAWLALSPFVSSVFLPAVAADQVPSPLQASVQALNQGDPEKARNILLDARAKDPHATGIDFGLGLVAFTQRHFDVAETELQKAIEAKDMAGDSENLIGVIRAQQGKPAEAIVHFRNSIAANPENADALVNLAEALRADGEPKEAYGPLTRAIALNSSKKSYYELKLRFARIDAGDMVEVEQDTAAKFQAKDIPMDWVMTAAAINLRRARMEEAVALLTQAQKAMPPEMFRNIMEDRAFRFYSAEPPIAAFYPSAASATAPKQ